ncbi:MAG: alpha/beta hydrolase-fold protein [Pseudomonadota bacterium]
MTRKCWRLLPTLAIALSGLSAQAQQPTPPAPPTLAGYTLPATQMWDMPSGHGDIYRIMLSFPKGEPPAGGYPVLYILDGNASFASFAETRRLLEYAGQGKALIVGVGYPTDQAYDARRTADFLYPVPTREPPAQPQPQLRTKDTGRDRFLDFLTGKLRTEIGKRYRIDLDRQSLFGHSFGGLFALHALYTRPEAFYSIVAASPSLGWNMQDMLREERAFTAGLASGKTVRMSRLMLVVGDQDTDDDPEPARALASRLDLLSGYGLSTRFRRYDAEIHITVPTRAVTDTLRFVF